MVSLVNWALRQRVAGRAVQTCNLRVWSVEPRGRNARVKVAWSRMAAVLALKGVIE